MRQKRLRAQTRGHEDQDWDPRGARPGPGCSEPMWGKIRARGHKKQDWDQGAQSLLGVRLDLGCPEVRNILE